MYYFHAAGLGQLPYAGTEFLQDRIFPGPQLVEIDPRFTETDTAVSRVAGLEDELGGVEQCLGRDTSAVQANAPEAVIFLDENDLLAVVRRVKRRCVTAGPGADNYEICGNGFHGSESLCG